MFACLVWSSAIDGCCLYPASLAVEWSWSAGIQLGLIGTINCQKHQSRPDCYLLILPFKRFLVPISGHSFGFPNYPALLVLRHVWDTFELIAEFGSWPQRSSLHRISSSLTNQLHQQPQSNRIAAAWATELDGWWWAHKPEYFANKLNAGSSVFCLSGMRCCCEETARR